MPRAAITPFGRRSVKAPVGGAARGARPAARPSPRAGAALALALLFASPACGDSGDAPDALPSAGAGGASAAGGAPSTPGASGSAGAAGSASAGVGGASGAGGAGGADGELPPGVGACNVRRVESPPTSAFHQLECSDITYSTNPPSGGDHYAVWAAFQVYDTPVPPGFLVHSLEHGAVVFWYNCPEGCADEVAEVESFIASLPEDPLCAAATAARRAVLVPHPELASRWAASAWGFALTADCFDPEEFESFYTEHVGQAPEDFCTDGRTDVVARCP